jgi:hypothetical protein
MLLKYLCYITYGLSRISMHGVCRDKVLFLWQAAAFFVYGRHGQQCAASNY